MAFARRSLYTALLVATLVTVASGKLEHPTCYCAVSYFISVAIYCTAPRPRRAQRSIQLSTADTAPATSSSATADSVWTTVTVATEWRTVTTEATKMVAVK